MSDEKIIPAEPHCPECKAKGFENIIARVEKIPTEQPLPLGLELDLVIVTCKQCGHVYQMLRPRI